MNIEKRNKIREELIFLMRGFYSLPILLNLHKSGILKKFSLKKYVSINKIKVKNKFFLEKIFKYLTRLNLLEQKENSYKFTKLGLTVSKRIGTFYILNSYSKIPLNFVDNLKKNNNFKSWCERKDNILGSGLIHKKKFFIPGIDLSYIGKKNTVLDIGCGDGSFLNLVKKTNPKIKILGCDLSNKSVMQTKKNLKVRDKDFIFRADGLDIGLIKKKLDKKNIYLNKNSLISMWFLLHEISNNSKNTLIKYLNNVRNNFPETPILIGEISSLNDNQVRAHNKISILPEFKLFHELTGQGLLTELDYFSIFNRSSYKIKKLIRTDKLKYNGIYSSSNFVCLIEPKK
jgi:SAM-dependent methyltransferase